MANGSQTVANDDEELVSGEALENIYQFAQVDNQANITDSPSTLSPDVGYIKQIQNKFPEYQGINAHNMVNRMLTDDEFLDEVTSKLFTEGIKGNEKAREYYSDAEKYQEHYNDLKRNIQTFLAQNAVTGESVSNTIVKRKMDIYKKPGEKGSASWRNNNPLNIMYDKSSPELKNKISERGIEMRESKIKNEDGTLAKFGTYEDGWKAARIALTESYADSTVTDALKSWSNGGYDGSIVDEKLRNKKIKELKPEQLDQVMKRMEKHEGWITPENSPFQQSIPLEDYKEQIRKNPERYEEFGIVDEKGNLTYDGLEDENKLFQEVVSQNDKLHRKLVEDRYNKFETLLDNEHNSIKALTQNPSFKAQAFAVYDEFGSEGLTNFVNLHQRQYLGEEAVSDKEAKQALDWYRSNKVGRITRRFIGRGKNRMSFRPPKSTLDVRSKIPADTNYWTADKYRFNDEKEEFEVKSDEEIARSLMTKFSTWGEYYQTKEEARKADVSRYTGLDISTQDAAKAVAEDSGLNPDQLKEEAIKQMVNREESGFFNTSFYSYFLADAMSDLKSEGKVQSLIKTIQANGNYIGDQKWAIDYNNSDLMTKIAVDALNQDDQFRALVKPGSTAKDVLNDMFGGENPNENTAILDLNRMKDVKKETNDWLNKFYAEEKVYDEETKSWQTKPKEGWMNWIQNGLVSVGFGTMQALDMYGIQPTMNMIEGTFNEVHKITGDETSEDIARFFDYHNESDLVEGVNNFSIGSFMGESDIEMIRNSDNWWYEFPAKTTPIWQYALAVYGSTKGLLQGAKWILPKLGKASKAMSGAQMSKLLKGGKLETYASRWEQAMGNSNWGTAGTYIFGDVAMESALPKHRTLANMGTKFHDQMVEKFNGKDPNLNEKYKATSGIVRTGVDAATSFALSVFMDGIIGATKYGKDLYRGKVRGKGVPTLIEKTTKSGKRVKKTLGKGEYPEWRPDIREFTANLTHEIDQWAIGDFKESMMKQLTTSTREMIEDGDKKVTDFTVKTAKEINEVFGDDIYDVLEQSVRYYDNKLKGGAMSEAQITEITNNNYDQFIEQFGGTLYNMLDAQKGSQARLPLKVADALEQATITVKNLTQPDGTSRYSLDRANELAAENLNRLVKKVGDDEYVVQEVNPNYWLVDVAKKIRKNSLANDVNEPIARQLDAEGINVRADDLTEAENQRAQNINKWWHDLYGQRVNAGNTTGYVVGLGEEKGFKILTNDGEVIDNVGLKPMGQDMDDGLRGYIDEVGGGVSQKFDLQYESYKDIDEVANVIRQGQDAIDGDVQAHKQRLKDQLEVFFRTKELQRESKKGTPFIFGENEFRNQYGFSEKLTKFFAQHRETGRPTYQMVANVARNFGLDDERIRDLVRITRGGNEKRIIGKKNVGPIREWDAEKAMENGVPNDVLVKRTNRDGREMFFLTRRKTDIAPSRMVNTEDGLRLNPDWDMMGVNKTLKNDGSVQRFTEMNVDGETWYRPVEEGEDGVLLNIQNPIKSNDGELRLSTEDVLAKDIDAVVADMNGTKIYKPLSQEDQVLDPDQVIREADRSGLKITQTKEPSVEEGVEVLAQSRFLPKGSMRHIGMGALGTWVGDWFDEEDSNFWAYTLGGAGFVFANKGARKRVGKVFRAGGRTGLDKMEGTFRKLKEWSGEYENNFLEKELYGTGYDTRAEHWQEWKDGFFGRLRQAMETGEDMTKAFRDNPVVKSMFSMLEDYADIPLVKEAQHRLLNVEHGATELKSRLTMIYNRKVGDDTAFDSLNDDMVSFVRQWRQEQGIGEGGTVGEQKALDVFHDALWRIMNARGRIENGVYKYDPIENVERAYQRGEGTLKDLDEAILRHERLGNYPDAMRDWFDGIKKRYISSIQKKKEDVLAGIDHQYIKLANRMYQFAGSVDEFKNTLSKDDRLLWRKAMNDVNFVKLRDLKSQRDAFTDLGRNYYPAIFSRKQMQRSESRYIQNYLRNNTEATEREARTQFRREIKQEFYELNKTEGGRPNILEKVSLSEKKVENRTFPDEAGARSYFDNMIKNPDNGLSEKEIAELKEIEDEYIKKGTKQAYNEEGQQVTKDYYYIEEPAKYREIYDVVGRENKKANMDFFELISSGFHIKNSDHLERPRKYKLPDRIVEKNHENILFKYTQDVGTRMHFIEDGIFDEDDFVRKYLAPITRKLKDKLGADHPDVSKFRERLMDIYKQQTGMAREVRSFKDKEEAIRWYNRKAAVSKWVQTWRNVIGAGYIYGISFYDWFQHAIFTPLLTSWGSYKQGISTLATDRESFNRMKEVAKTFHYADQKAKTFMPELSGQQYAESQNNMATEWAFSGAKWLREKAANFSFTKMASKTGMFDIDDWGMFNMLGGGFYDVNETATSINVLAHLIEAEELARVGRMMKEQDVGRIRVPTRLGGEKVYTMGDVRSGLARVGIAPSDFDDFLAKNKELNDVIDFVRNGEKRNMKLSDLDHNTDGFKYMENIINTAVDSYHGRNKMARPLTWNTDLGKLAAQYSFYHQNFALQTTQRRIRQPISNWNKQFGEELTEDMPMWKMLMQMQRGDKGIKKLKEAGLSDEAINQLPINAMYTMAKFLPAAGLTFLMETGREAWQDIAGIATDLAAEAMGGDLIEDSEHWKRLDRQEVINKYAPKSEQVTWDEALNDPDLRKSFLMLGQGLGTFANLGTGGRWGTTFFQQSRFSDNSALEAIPIGREVEDMIDLMGNVGSTFYRGPVHAGKETSKTIYDWTARKVPVVGSFSLVRNKVKDAIFNKPNKPNQVYDVQDDELYDLENYSLPDY